MSFQGSLDTVGLSDVFQLFAFSRKSGALHLRSGERHGIVYFDAGDVYYGTAAPGEGVGNLLVKAALVTPEQWKNVLAASGDKKAHGELLLAEDGIDADAVEAFIQERIEDAIFRLMQWDHGEFELEDEQHPFGSVFKFACDPLLAEGERRLQVWSEISETIPSTDMGVRVRHELPDGVDDVTVTRDEWRLIAAIQTGTSIVDLAASLGKTEFRVVQALHELISRDLVELISEEKLTVIRSLVGDATGREVHVEAPVDDVPAFDADAEAAEASGVAGSEPEAAEAEAAAGVEVADVPDLDSEAPAEAVTEPVTEPVYADADDTTDAAARVAEVDAGYTEEHAAGAEDVDAGHVGSEAETPDSYQDAAVDTAREPSFEELARDAEDPPHATGETPAVWDEGQEPTPEDAAPDGPVPDAAAAYAEPAAPAPPQTPDAPPVSLADMAAQAETEGTVETGDYQHVEPDPSAGYGDQHPPAGSFYDQNATVVQQGGDANFPTDGPDTGAGEHPVPADPNAGVDQPVHPYQTADAAEAAAHPEPAQDAGEAGEDEPDDGAGGEANELDKSLILRLIAGVRSL